MSPNGKWGVGPSASPLMSRPSGKFTMSALWWWVLAAIAVVAAVLILVSIA